MGRLTPKIRGKKGIFFTFIAITIMGVFILMFTPQTELELDSETDSIEVRIENIDAYAQDIQTNYFTEAIKSSSYHSFLALIYYMNETGTYTSEIGKVFQEVIVHGTLNGTSIDSQIGKSIMENNTILNWSRRIEEVGTDTYNVQTNITVSSATVTQTNPWQIDVVLYINYSIVSEVAEWSMRNFSIKTKVSIEGWIDPAYLVENSGLYFSTIRRETTDFNDWNLSSMSAQIENGTYVHWPYSSAPSYLMRFEGIWDNSSCCGIHSLARPGNLTVPDQRGSYVDYMLWNNSLSLDSDCPRVYNITHPSPPANIGVWDKFRYFKLDKGHTDRYNITSEYYVQGGC